MVDWHDDGLIMAMLGHHKSVGSMVIGGVTQAHLLSWQASVDHLETWYCHMATTVGVGESDSGRSDEGEDKQLCDVAFEQCLNTHWRSLRFAIRFEVQNLRFRFHQSLNLNLPIGFRSKYLMD